jgi:hypothetical protein
MSKELINWLDRQLNAFESDRVASEENDLPIDYAYADGAYTAFQAVLIKLTESEETNA